MKWKTNITISLIFGKKFVPKFKLIINNKGF